MKSLLLIDDDERHSKLLRDYLQRFDIELDCAYDADEGLKLLQSRDYDLLLLDVMLPGRDGFDICREVRKSDSIPIIMLTARGDVIDRVSGLELGADDYIAKPFEPRELVARIQSILRRATANTGGQQQLVFDGITIDQEARTVRVDGDEVELTSMEYELLVLLASNAGKKISRDEILSNLRGIDAAILTRSVDIMISRLRSKLRDPGKPARFIQTIWGRGYLFVGRVAKNA
ncbi:response regulator transcription factor [Woeseia oceani]|uniref:DNA-binding response regulator n=1 Tax=Woeseia oceani TaxID=1548547 RepID=A0A193LFL1_9GAMM|nr:response regulator transcription factor [Woeseia oceani]ANO51253.1 DNA-binding response regulator [Woeseia oceani]